VTIVVRVIIMAAVTAWFAWVAWFMHRLATSGKRHHATLPTVAAHHPLPKTIAGGGELYDLDEVAKEFGVDLGPDTETRPAPQHTHRDPTTGRYTRKEQ